MYGNTHIHSRTHACTRAHTHTHTQCIQIHVCLDACNRLCSIFIHAYCIHAYADRQITRQKKSFRNLGLRKIFPSPPQTRRQVSAYALELLVDIPSVVSLTHQNRHAMEILARNSSLPVMHICSTGFSH